jgi:O-antigen ligase
LASPWANRGQQIVEDYLKVVVFFFMIVLVVQDEAGLRHLLLGFLGVMALYMLHSLIEYAHGRHTFRMGIARLIGVDTSMGDPNSFGATIVYALPFLIPFWRTQPSWTLRSFLLCYLALSVICVGLTGSRSAFLGLLLWAVVAVLWSRWRWPLLILTILVVPILWAALPAPLQNRFETIVHPEVGPANAAVSGKGRIEGLMVGLNLWAKYPLSGCGPGAWRPATGRPLEAHNLYGQLLGELGTLGLGAFLAILVGFWSNLRGVRRAYRQHPEWDRDFPFYLAGAVGLSLVLLLFEGNFSHNLFRYGWLWYGGFLIAARHCTGRRLEETARVEAEPGNGAFVLEGVGS